MFKVAFLAAFVAIAGGLISITTPATSQNQLTSLETIVPLAMPVPANLPIESYQAV